MTIALILHLVAASLALPLGAYVLLRRKGTVPHKAAGRLWAGLMAAAALSSFFLDTTGSSSIGIPHIGGIGPLHALSAFTLFSLVMGVAAIRRGAVERHRRWMTGPYIGLVVAGVLALAPGRLLLSTLAG